MAVRLAWRDLRASRARPAFLVAAMAISVAYIGAIRSAANIAGSVLHGQSRSWLGGDLAATTGAPLEEDQVDALNQMRARGIEWTLVTTGLTMGSASEESPDASLMAVKAVDPTKYPFYGGLAIEPPQALSAALDPDTAIVSKDVLDRFGVQLGDEIWIGGTSFRITGVIATEPDRFSGVTALGIRCILSQEGFERSGIARSGDSVRLRILIRLPAGVKPAPVRHRLGVIFPEGGVMDFREASRNAVSTLETTALFLDLIGLVALILGAIGMAMAVRQHIDERAYTLAVMRMIGARNRHLAGVFLFQILWLAAAAFLVGVPLGWGMRSLVLSLAGRYVHVPRTPLMDYGALFDAAAAAFAALTPTVVYTILAITRVKPAILLRRDVEAAPVRSSRVLAVAAWGAACVVLGAIAARLLESWKLAAILVASLAASAAVAFLIVTAVLASVRRWTPSHALSRAPLLRQGLANLCRPGNRGTALIVSLSIGLMMMIASFQLNQAVTRTILQEVPFDRPDLLIPAIESRLRDTLPAFLARQPGVEDIQVGSQARGRLHVANRRGFGTLVGCLADEERAVRPEEATVAEDLARSLRVRLGSRLEFEAAGRIVHSTVTSIRPMTPVEKFWYAVRIDCSGLDRSSLFYQVSAHIRPDRIAAVRRALIAEFPAVPVFTAEDLAEVIGKASLDALLLARWVAFYALGSSLGVLIAIVSASRGFRQREIAIFSALGACRRAMVTLYTCEFAAMGIFAGSIAGLLAYGFTAVAVFAILSGVHAVIEWKSPMVAMVAAGLLSIAGGWLPIYGLLKRKPLDVLRGE